MEAADAGQAAGDAGRGTARPALGAALEELEDVEGDAGSDRDAAEPVGSSASPSSRPPAARTSGPTPLLPAAAGGPSTGAAGRDRGATTITLPPGARPLTLLEAVRLRCLLVGPASADRRLSSAWLQQGLFTDSPAEGGRCAPYGLVQRRGGPCGVLAGVQAAAIRRLLFGAPAAAGPALPACVASALPQEGLGRLWRGATAPAMRAAVVLGLADVLWRCSTAGSARPGRAALVLPSRALAEPLAAGCKPAPLPPARGVGAAAAAAAGITTSDGEEVLEAAAAYVPDGVSEQMTVTEFDDFGALVGAIEAVFDGVFGVRRGVGVLAVLYSVVLSRGIGGGSVDAGAAVDGVAGDMDGWAGGESQLIGGHNYATQALVSLMLTGRARSNVFDGEKRLGEGEDVVLLRGIDAQSDCGLLSLFEHYRQLEVGSHLKHPTVPVWVVCSESHYTVLWSADAELVRDGGDGESTADLFYWDGLAKPEDEIRLTVTPSTALQALRDIEEEAEEAAEPAGRARAEAVPGLSGLGDGGSLRGLLAELSGSGAAGRSAGAGAAVGDPEEDEDGAPPLNLVLRTRWSGCRVSWNGVEPWL